jgi:hypothetical protein
VQLDEVLDDRQAEPEAAVLRVVEASAWRKRSKTCGRNSADADAGVGDRDLHVRVDALAAETCTRPPFGVNLIALDSRFQITCCRRLGSPETGPARGSRTVSSRHVLGLGCRADGFDRRFDESPPAQGLHVEAHLARR